MADMEGQSPSEGRSKIRQITPRLLYQTDYNDGLIILLFYSRISHVLLG